MKLTLLLLLALVLVPLSMVAQPKRPATAAPGEEMLNEYFRAETAKLSRSCLEDIQTLADWNASKEEYRRQLFEMLGLWPLPEKSNLNPTITGKLEHEQFSVEKLCFESMPGLFITANLYVPKNLTQPAPAILYLCGHSKMITNGVSYGNKTGYQHHGAWFARNGYVCLVLDTIQLGELQGIHHGTYREKMWWWNARGYTPAGVEAWNSIRALDYLQSRPEVNPERLGVTGRSGGGAYSWYLTALDDRIKVAAPIAGITDLQNHVVDGCIEGHCDCMFMVNTYRWDFPLLAALAAPRPLLLGNSDKDRIFPLDGIVRLHSKLKRIYDLHGASNHLGLLVTEGPHEDTQDLQVPVFRWFNRFLKGQDSVIDQPAVKMFSVPELRVLTFAPTNEHTTKIHETFVPTATSTPPANPAEWNQMRDNWRVTLAEKVFSAWPLNSGSVQTRFVGNTELPRLFCQKWDFATDGKVTLPLYVLRSNRARPKELRIRVLDEADWKEWASIIAAIDSKQPIATTLSQILQAELSKGPVVFVMPRGIGPTAWNSDPVKETHIRRRFMLLGTTVDAMRVWDICRALEALNSIPEFRKIPLQLESHGPMAVNALYASLFVPPLKQVTVSDLPASHRTGPDYLNVMKYLDVPQALAMALEKSPVTVQGDGTPFAFASQTAQNLGWKNLKFAP